MRAGGPLLDLGATRFVPRLACRTKGLCPTAETKAPTLEPEEKTKTENTLKSVGARLLALLSKERHRGRTKYGNKKVYTEEGVFDSQAEYQRWEKLKLLEKLGELSALKRQVRMPLHVNGIKIGDYIADFQYYPRGNAHYVVEDVKGHRTQLFSWKARHFKAEYGFAIQEVKAWQ